MGSRMDKYNDEVSVPTRSDKNKTLYKQIYSAYDEFENLIVPSNAREINVSDLKKEITSREEYRKKKDYDSIVNREIVKDDIELREKVYSDHDNGVYDIKELLDKALNGQKEVESPKTTLSNADYLKKIKLDNYKTNIEQVKEIYNEVLDESLEEDEALIKTANLSLEILSDLKGDSDGTKTVAPIKSDELPKDSKDLDFYSSNYKFSKSDFEDNDANLDDEDDDERVYDIKKHDKWNAFIKIVLCVFGISLIIIILLYVFNYFNQV